MDETPKQNEENIIAPEEVTELVPEESSTSEQETANSEQNKDSQETAGYGVEAPSVRVYPSGLPKSDETSSSNDGDISLETIYGRRKEKDNTDQNDAEIKSVEPNPLPPHPFSTRLLRPLVNPGMFIKLGCLAALLWGLLSIVVPLFQRSAHGTFKEGGLSGAEKMILGRKGEIVFGAWRSYAYLFLFAFVPWFFCAIPFLLQITEQTSDCDDKISDWPELSPIPMICRFGWFLLLVLTAGLPGYLILGLIGMGHFGFVLTLFILFPIFYLSTADTDSFFCLLSKNILHGVKLAPKAWRNWYFLSLVLTVLSLLLFFISVGDGIFRIRGVAHTAIVVAFCAVLIPFSIFLYFRLLGGYCQYHQGRRNGDCSGNRRVPSDQFLRSSSCGRKTPLFRFGGNQRR